MNLLHSHPYQSLAVDAFASVVVFLVVAASFVSAVSSSVIVVLAFVVAVAAAVPVVDAALFVGVHLDAVMNVLPPLATAEVVVGNPAGGGWTCHLPSPPHHLLPNTVGDLVRLFYCFRSCCCRARLYHQILTGTYI